MKRYVSLTVNPASIASINICCGCSHTFKNLQWFLMKQHFVKNNTVVFRPFFLFCYYHFFSPVVSSLESEAVFDIFDTAFCFHFSHTVQCSLNLKYLTRHGRNHHEVFFLLTTIINWLFSITVILLVSVFAGYDSIKGIALSFCVCVCLISPFYYGRRGCGGWRAGLCCFLPPPMFCQETYAVNTISSQFTKCMKSPTVLLLSVQIKYNC